jgi:hypothetical protein
MRAGHSSPKASLSRYYIVSTAECECGDGLQTEEHIFWDCKLYEDQRATMMDILSENCKTEYPKSVIPIIVDVFAVVLLSIGHGADHIENTFSVVRIVA